MSFKGQSSSGEMSRIIFHIDVNSAYLSWTAVEQLKNGADEDLRTKNAIIGGSQESRHGVVLAKSLSAKKYGVRTGEPVANALRKCPNLIIEPPNHKLYHDYSQKLMEFLYTYTPDIEQVSVDECFLDFTGISHNFTSPVAAALKIKDEIYSRFGFTVNIGISENKLLAKMASDFEKPNKVHTLFKKEISAKMWPLPVWELYMAGKSSVETFKKLEIHTIGDLANADPAIIELHLKSHGRMLWEFANGIDESEVISKKTDAKGIGNSTTLPRDVVTEEEAREVLLSLAESVGLRLREAGQKANMISVEIKYHTFETSSHQKQLANPTNSDNIIFQSAAELFREMWTKEPIRLLGIRSSKLVKENEPEQLSLFDMELGMQNTESVKSMKKSISRQRQKQLDRALDEIRRKYGEDAVKRGRFLK